VGRRGAIQAGPWRFIRRFARRMWPPLVIRAESRTRERMYIYIYMSIGQPCCAHVSAASLLVFLDLVCHCSHRAPLPCLSLSHPLSPLSFVSFRRVRPLGGGVTTATPIVNETLMHVLKKHGSPEILSILWSPTTNKIVKKTNTLYS
jgi:hypothetical protein